jgi:hypothetical protein
MSKVNLNGPKRSWASESRTSLMDALTRIYNFIGSDVLPKLESFL